MRKETLCWSCNKTCGRCSWTRDFKPVKGWEAVPVAIKSGYGLPVDSYIVLKCPEFEKFSYNAFSAMPANKLHYYKLFQKLNKYLTSKERLLISFWFKHSVAETSKKFDMAPRTCARRLSEIKNLLITLSAALPEQEKNKRSKDEKEVV